MKNYALSLVIALAAFAATVSAVHAALVPSYTLSLINNNTQIQVTVFGADPNAAVNLYYPGSSGVMSANLGQTNQSGFLSAVVSPSTYNIVAGASTYVIVDGQQSQIVQWPSYSTGASNASAYLSFNQSVITVPVGQTTTILGTTNTGTLGSLNVNSNTNPAVASAAVSGSQVTISGLTVGATTLTICASNAGCTPVYVTVQSQSTPSNQQTSSGQFAVSPSSVTLTSGQSQIVNVSGPGSYFLSSNSKITVATAVLSGSQLTITARDAGTSNISVCAVDTSTNSTACGAVTVTVNPSSSPTPTPTVNSTTMNLSFSPSEADVTVGQTISVAISSPNANGSSYPGYFVSNNQNSSVATVNINNSTATITGVAAGGSNVTICQQGYGCGTLYVFVTSPAGTNQSAAVTTAVLNPAAAPVLTSFTVSSNTVNHNFISPGTAITVNFGLSTAATQASVTVNGHQATVYGSGVGPYTAIYTLGSAESAPLSISIAFSNAAGSDRLNLSLGSEASAMSGAANVAAAAAALGSSATFTSTLAVGSTGSEVTALQKRLTADGLYSGPVTGKFGYLTQVALKKYQTKHDLSPVGIVGPATRALLNQGI